MIFVYEIHTFSANDLKSLGAKYKPRFDELLKSKNFRISDIPSYFSKNEKYQTFPRKYSAYDNSYSLLMNGNDIIGETYLILLTENRDYPEDLTFVAILIIDDSLVRIKYTLNDVDNSIPPNLPDYFEYNESKSNWYYKSSQYDLSSQYDFGKDLLNGKLNYIPEYKLFIKDWGEILESLIDMHSKN